MYTIRVYAIRVCVCVCFLAACWAKLCLTAFRMVVGALASVAGLVSGLVSALVSVGALVNAFVDGLVSA